jgi:hypothetical protein
MKHTALWQIAGQTPVLLFSCLSLVAMQHLVWLVWVLLL